MQNADARFSMQNADARRAYRDALMRHMHEANDFALTVKHRTLHHRRHPLRRRLPTYAERELAGVRDRSLLSQVPTHLCNVWTEGDLDSREAVTIPLTGWSTGSSSVLTFDAVRADMDKKPLLVSTTNGPLQLASEMHLTFRGILLRVWRFGQPNPEAYASGKRTINLLPGGGHGAQSAELRNATGEQWHAQSEDSGLLLQLDVPSYGTDGLLDAWHVTKAQVALSAHEFYRALSPALYPRWPLLRLPERRVAEGPASSDCELELSLCDAHGERVASGRCPCVLSAVPAALELRRVDCLRVCATPVEPTVLLTPQADVEGVTAEFAPRTGIASVVLRQQGHVVAATAGHFMGAVGGLTARFSLGDATYNDESGVTQREQQEGSVSYANLVVTPKVAADPAAEVGHEVRRGDEPMDVDALTAQVESQSLALAHEQPVRWEVHGLRWEALVPAADTPGVSFAPHACGPDWVRGLRRLGT